jgi:hypothetical protein
MLNRSSANVFGDPRTNIGTVVTKVIVKLATPAISRKNPPAVKFSGFFYPGFL